MQRYFKITGLFLILAFSGCTSKKIVTTQFSDGSYEGQVNSKEQKHGKGLFKWNDGSYYNGDFNEDLRHGKGRFLWANGENYEGDYDEDQRTGKGQYRWPDGSSFVGDFVRGKRRGKGVFISHDGIKYEGEWLDDLQHGHGKLFFPDGNVVSGTWINGELIPSKSMIPAPSKSVKLNSSIDQQPEINVDKNKFSDPVESTEAPLLSPVPDSSSLLSVRGTTQELLSEAGKSAVSQKKIDNDLEQLVNLPTGIISSPNNLQKNQEDVQSPSFTSEKEVEIWEGTVMEAELAFRTELINGLDTVKFRKNDSTYSGKMNILDENGKLVGEVNLLNGLLHGEENFFGENGEIVEQNIWNGGIKKEY